MFSIFHESDLHHVTPSATTDVAVADEVRSVGAFFFFGCELITLPSSLSLLSLKFNVRQNRKTLPRESGPQSRKKFQYENSSACRKYANKTKLNETRQRFEGTKA